MSIEVRNLEPKVVWENFEDLNAVPRASKKEERVIAFIKKFGEDLHLEVLEDEVGNVIIKKPATAGMEDREPVVLQGHLDMVHQKNNDTNFDFDTMGIQSYIDGDWVRAKGTTLGADNGMGVAAAMAILASKDLAHPAVEALFTIDEETGMTGAIGLKGGLLEGKYLLNMDTEEDNELTIGCAGGIDTTVTMSYNEESPVESDKAYRLTIKGLVGGHSGMDIIKERANANRLMARVFYGAYEKFGLRISSFDGGSLRNAIPREAVSTVTVSNTTAFEQYINEMQQTIQTEYAHADGGIQFELKEIDLTGILVMDIEAQKNILRALIAMPNGVYRMTTDMPGLVETSSNQARVLIKGGEFTCLSLQRSSVESQKDEIADAIQATFEMIGAKVVRGGSYPGWTPKPSSTLVELFADKYRKMFKEEPLVNACHAGLECGILGRNYPDMEMISYGPTIRGAHSPDESVSISSVAKFWDFTVEVLANIPEKKD